MSKLTDNNGWLVARGTESKLRKIVERQRRFDSTYALWLTTPSGKTERVL